MKFYVPKTSGILVLALSYCLPAVSAYSQGGSPYLSASDLHALGQGHSAWAPSLAIARDYQTAKEAQIQALYLKVQGKKLNQDLSKAVNALGNKAPEAMRRLIASGAGQDSRGRFTLAGFRFQDLRNTKNSELKNAFQSLFPYAQGRWNEILDPKRKTVLLVEGHVLLPPALATQFPSQKFTPAVPWSVYEKAVAQELSGIDSDLREWLKSSREGGTWADLVHEVGAFYSNDVWGNPAWSRAHDAEASGAQNRAGIRLLRLKSKWGLAQGQLDAALAAYAQVQAQAAGNREQAISDLGAKSTAIALAPLLYPVAAYGLLPAFGFGMGITGIDALASAGIETSARGGSFTAHLARELDQKLPHGFTFSLLFAPAGALHKAATSTHAWVRTGARVAGAGMVATAGLSSVENGKAAAEAHQQLNKPDGLTGSAPQPELQAALRADFAKNALHATTDGIFAAIGIKGAIPVRQRQPSPILIIRPVAASAPTKGPPFELPPPQNEAIALERQRLISLMDNGFEPQDQRFKRMVEGGSGDRMSRSQYVAAVLDSAKKLLHLQGTKIEIRSILEGEIITISPVRDGSSLNQIAWILKQRAKTKLVFDPEALIEEGSVAYFSPDRNEICISYHEVLRGSRSRATSLKHEVRHLIREKIEGLPFRGHILFFPEREGPYGKYQQLDEVISQAWDLIDTAKAIATYGRTPFLERRLNSKANMVLSIIRNTKPVLQAVHEKPSLIQLPSVITPGPAPVSAAIPELGSLSIQLNPIQETRMDRKNFPIQLGTSERATFLNAERELLRKQLVYRIGSELWLLRVLEERIPAFKKSESDLKTLTKELADRLRYVDTVIDHEARKQFLAMELQNKTAAEAFENLQSLYRDLTQGKIPFDSLESAESLLQAVEALQTQSSRRLGKPPNQADDRTEYAYRVTSTRESIRDLITQFSKPLHLSRGRELFSRALELRQNSEAEGETLQTISDALHHFRRSGSRDWIEKLRAEFPTEVDRLDDYGRLLNGFDFDFGSSP